MRQSSAQQVRYSIDTVLALQERGGRRILPVSTEATYGRGSRLPEKTGLCTAIERVHDARPRARVPTELPR